MDQSDQGLRLISDIIKEILDIDVSVLMGANIASEVAEEHFCETTIGLLFEMSTTVAHLYNSNIACYVVYQELLITMTIKKVVSKLLKT